VGSRERLPMGQFNVLLGDSIRAHRAVELGGRKRLSSKHFVVVRRHARRFTECGNK
jgi:hypothetical protein